MDEQEMAIWEGLGVTPEEPEQTEEPELEELEPEEVDTPDSNEEGEPGDAEPEEDGADGGGDGPDPDELRQQHDRELEDLRRQHQQQMDAHVAGLKLTNPYDGNKPINTLAEYQAYQAAHQQAQWDSIRQRSGLTQEQMDELIGNLPQVQQAAQAQAQAKAAQDAADEQALQQKLREEIAAIGKLCPEIRDRETLVEHESWPRVAQRMKDTKCGVLDAFKLENFDALQQRRAEDARRQRDRNQRGKEHLRGTTGKGKGGASIPADQLKIYQRLNPGASLNELQAFHAANNKK